MKPAAALASIVALGAFVVAAGLAIGSDGLGWPAAGDPTRAAVLWDIRLPRSLGAWLAGALLGAAGAIAQGLFRNPLADPYLLGSASGAALAVALALALAGGAPFAAGWLASVGLTGAAFAGAIGAVLVTLALAAGVQHTLRLLLAGVVVGVVLAAITSLTMLFTPGILRQMQAFMLGTTGYLGWTAVGVLAVTLAIALAPSLALARALDALALGEDTARSLGVPLGAVRVALIAALALATGAAVAQTGLIAFVGLVAPHLVRSRVATTHRALVALSAATGGALLAAADLLARSVIAPEELPVGAVTAVLGGLYLLARMSRAGALEAR